MSAHTLNQLVEMSRDFDSRKENYDGKKYAIGFNKDCRVNFTDRLSSAIVPNHKMTENAWSQLAGKFGSIAFGKGSGRSLPKDALMAWAGVFPDHTAALLNAHVGAYKGGLLVRTFDSSVRAILSDQYAVVDNTEVLKTIQKALELAKRPEAGNIPSFHSEVTPDSMRVKFTLANINTNSSDEPGGGQYGVGFYASNDETGNGKLTISPYIQRHSCQNSIVFTGEDTGMSQVHRGIGQLLADRMALAIGSALKLSQNLLGDLMNSKQVEIPDFHKTVLDFAEQQGWSVDVTSAIMAGSEGHQSLFGLVNGLTFAAHRKLETVSEQVAMETLAGRILTEPESIFSKAAWARVPVVAER